MPSTDFDFDPNLSDFRSHLTNVDRKGKRVWLYPAIIKGSLYKYRTYLSYLLIGGLIALPYIEINGNPFVLLNILERKFILFGIPFFPQDFHIFVLLTLALVVFIVLFTAVYGRVFCGWTCPQTIFMEMVFRKIENLIEGNHKKQEQLDKSEWNFEKIWKKSLKHTIFWLISFGIANLFLAYIIGRKELWKIMTEPPQEHILGLFIILIFSTVFYLVFAKLREIVCVVICPYGRLQGVMLDKNSIVVAYDYLRGEPRGKKSKIETETPKGDCVDCGLCVQVCPTGIDIRNGTQLECINCTACIDACNFVMDKVDRPRDLITFNSLDGIKNNIKFSFTNRLKAYTAVLVLLISLVVYMLATRSQLEASVLRNPGTLYQKAENEMITNLYNYNLVNKSFFEMPLEIKIEGTDAKIKFVGEAPNLLDPEEVMHGSFFIEVAKKDIKKGKMKLKILFYSNGKQVDEAKVTFIGPVF
jgi:cytochrome c oxidase accessory protein FixG